MKSFFLFLAISSLSCIAAAQTNQAETTSFQVNYEKFVLDNGLEVVFHIDRSDPVVAVNLTAHVGSSREIEGRTGFAHVFEHLLFLESENLGKGGLDKMSARIGGSGANGSTSRDVTNYLQTVPNDALEKMLWAEADKLGWFINTVTQPVLEKEKQVVKNEKRQSVDNRPYGHNFYVIDKHLYPANHPYSWQVIGSLQDVQSATLQDVKDFFERWYVPNNVTLTVAGDFDPVQAKGWIKKYFDEIKRGDDVSPLKTQNVTITKTQKLYHEDNFANVPQYTRVHAGVEQYHKDSYALTALTTYLSEGKSAPLYKVLVEEKQLVPSIFMFNRSDEIAGQIYLLARAYDGVDLDEVNKAINQVFALFEKEGVSEEALTRIKASLETDFYNGLSSVIGKSRQLAAYNTFLGEPGYASTEIANILALTTADLKRVYNTYIKDKHFVATSFVPKGQVELALNGSVKAEVVEEQVVQNAEAQVKADGSAEYVKTPSIFDRSKEPSFGESPDVKVPDVWRAQAGNIRIMGIESSEVPLVNFEIVIDGGQLLESIEKSGLSNLLAQMMTKGTTSKTPEELENAIKALGASIDVSAGDESITISGNTLARNYPQTMQLVSEIILSPRWDKAEFDLLKQQTLSQLQQQMAVPAEIAANQFSALLYGTDSIKAQNTLGNPSSVELITLDHLQAFYKAHISPHLSRMHVVGDIDKAKVTASLEQLQENWAVTTSKLPDILLAQAPKESMVYFYDVPDAKQTVVYIGYPALAATDKDFYPAEVMNYILGGGGFASKLTQSLREGKGYTYGIFSDFAGSKSAGAFSIFSRVRSNVTLESAQLIKDILEDYPSSYNEDDLATTKSFLIKSNARAFETARAKLGLLRNISKYGWPTDYVKQRETIVQNMTVERVQALAKQYLNSNKMIWLFVGDAKTQFSRMKDLGFGEPILLNKEGLDKADAE